MKNAVQSKTISWEEKNVAKFDELIAAGFEDRSECIEFTAEVSAPNLKIQIIVPGNDPLVTRRNACRLCRAVNGSLGSQ